MFNLNIGLFRHGREITRGIEIMDQDIHNATLRRAMEDSLQIILQSTIAGYKVQSAPDGTPWEPNAAWYAEMKGQDTRNVGPVSKTIQGGPFARTHELARVNIKRMQQSLTTENNTTRGVVKYEQQAEDRAKLTQFGGTSEFAIISKSTGGRLAFEVRAMARPHLGVATYNRIGSRTDAEWVEYYFGEQVETQLESS